MNKIMDFMMADHERLDGLFKSYQRSKSTNIKEAMEFFLAFRSDLERHIVWEEEILFPVFEKRTAMVEQGPTMVMRLEHRQIHEYLDRIEDALREGIAPADDLDRNLMDLLNRHNQKEESILYPWMDDVLTPEERANLLDRIKNYTEV